MIWVLANQQDGKEEQPNLSEIAEKLKDRELFPESNQRAKDFLSKVASAPKVEVSAPKLTAEDIVAEMREEMVFKISDVTVPYIVEAIERYATLKTSQLQSEITRLQSYLSRLKTINEQK